MAKRTVLTIIALGLALGGWLVFSSGGTAGAGDRFPDLLVERGVAHERIDTARERSTGAAQAALADRAVSRSEYRTAVDRTLSCLKTDAATEGITVTPTAPELSADGFEYDYGYQVSYGGPDALATADVVSSIEQACQATHLIDVQWSYQLAKRSDPAYVDQVARDFEACADSAGVDVDTRGRDALDVAVEMATPEAHREHPRARECIAASPAVTADLSQDPMQFIEP